MTTQTLLDADIDYTFRTLDRHQYHLPMFFPIQHYTHVYIYIYLLNYNRATLYNQVETIALLIHEGCLINEIDNSGFTPLLCAAWKGHTPAGELLLTRGADMFGEPRMISLVFIFLNI